MKNNNYKIEWEDFRGEYSIFYTEYFQDNRIRELRVDIDIVSNLFYYIPFAPNTVVLYLDSMQMWHNPRVELSLHEYSEVIERIYNYLRKAGYKITLK